MMESDKGKRASMPALKRFAHSFWYRTPPAFAVGLIALQFSEQTLIQACAVAVLALAVVESIVYACWRLRQHQP